MKLTLCIALVITLTGCGGKQQTWKDRMPHADCAPRTARAQAELGACPKLAHFQQPTLEEQAEIVRYLNRKNALEGTIVFGDYYPPGCATWTVDPSNDVPKFSGVFSASCGNNLQEKLRDFSIPGPATAK